MRRILIVGSLISLSVLLTACQTSNSWTTINITPNQQIKAEVVHSQAAVAKGLSNRSALASDEGMLFVFDEAENYTFWMKDMQFNLDIIWLNQGQIVDIWANAPKPLGGQLPAQYQPVKAADMVLEVLAGQGAIWGLKMGDSLSMPSKLDLLRVAR